MPVGLRKPRRGRHRRSGGPLRTPFPFTPADAWVFAIIGFITAVTRFAWITYPTDHGTPLFDEKHYVPQAWQILQSSPDILSGGIEDNPGYGLVVHPPVAKDIIAFGEWLFGYTPLGWRFMSAIAGIAVVLALMDIVRRISGSTLAVAIVGVYAVCDGVLFVSSRVGMLDIIQTAFIIGAAWALMVDRDHTVRRLAAFRDAPTPKNSWGPYMGWRWWRLFAGISLGLALGVKWSGLYYVAGFGLWSVFSDLVDRSRAGATRPVSGAFIRDTAPALRDLVAVPIGVYLLSWRSWFANETSVYRHQSPTSRDAGPLGFDWLPNSVLNYLHYQRGVLEFHASLTTSSGHKHPWESKPWEWLVSWRPMLYYSTDTTCFGDQKCKGWLMLFGTPPIWWILVPVMLWAMWRWVVRRDRRFGLAVVGFVVSWLPWAIAYDRQMYFFYATALVPFVLVACAIIAADLAQWTVRGRRVGLFIVGVHAALVLAAFVFWLPIMTGLPIPENHFNLRFWLPSWS